MLTINPSELIWTFINFFLLLFLLRRFLYKPILSVLDKRKALIADRRKEEEQLLDEIGQNEEKAARLISDGKKEADLLIASKHQEDLEKRNDLVKKAQEKAKQSRGETDTSIAALKVNEEADLDRQKDSLASLLAAQLLKPAAANESKGA